MFSEFNYVKFMYIIGKSLFFSYIIHFVASGMKFAASTKINGINFYREYLIFGQIDL